MRTDRPKGLLERGAPSSLWRNTLSQIPSLFGRLVYLASLRAGNSGTYEHHGLALLYGDAEADRALRASHEELFGEWLSYSLEQQKADIDLYLSALAGSRKSIIDTWQRLSPYRNVVPASARLAEKNLFSSDFEMLLSLLKLEFGVADQDPDA